MPNFISEHVQREVAADIGLLLRDMLKLIKALTLYPPDNPLPAKMLGSVGARFVDLVTQYDGLRFGIRSGEMLCQDSVVFTDKSREEALAGLFHEAGIIDLEFRRGLTLADFSAFLDSIKAYLNDRSPDRDLVSLLWQEQCPSIAFRTIEDVALSADEGISIQEFCSSFSADDTPGAGIVYGNILLEEHRSREDKAPAAESNQDNDEARRQTGISLVSPPNQPDPMAILAHAGGRLAEEDEAEIKALVEENRFFDPHRAAMKISMDLLQIWQDQKPALDTIEICEKLLDELLTAGAFAVAADFVHAMRGQQEEEKSRRPAVADRLGEFLRHAGDFARIGRLTDIINRQEKVDTASIEIYLEALGWESLAHIIGMLGKLVSKAARLMVCDYLARHGRANLTIIGGAVRDKRWYVARNAVMILGRIGGQEVLGYLASTVNHPHERVRAETIRALAANKESDAMDLLCRFLNDPDPQLRLVCLKQLERSGGRTAFEHLRSIVSSEKFNQFSMEEQQWFLTAYSRLGGDEVVDFLETLVGSVKLLGGPSIRHRLAALTALAHNRSDDAETAILNFTQSRRTWLREAATAALERRRTLLAGGGNADAQ